MAKVFLTSIDLAQNELQNAVVQNLASFPVSPLAGQIVFRTSDDILYYYDGTTWQAASGGGGGGAVNSVTAGDGTITIGGTGADPTVAVTPAGLDSSYITDFDAQVRTSRLDQMAAPTVAVSFNGQAITNLSDPTNPQDAATKNYVDLVSQGLDYKSSVEVATTGNITLSGEQTIDGVLTSASRVLVKDQTMDSENGIYVSAAGAWARSSDADASGEIKAGTLVFVTSGTANGSYLWICTATGATPWVPGTSSSTWTQYATGTNYTAGAGLTLTGTVFAIDDTVVVSKYAATIGDGANSSITVTHNLGTQDIITSIRDASTNEFVECDVVAISTTQAVFRFTVAPATNSLRVVVHG